MHCVLKRFRIPARSVDALADHPSAVPSDDLEQVKLHKAGHVLVESSVNQLSMRRQGSWTCFASLFGHSTSS